MKSRIVVVMLLAFFCCTQSNAQSFLENLGKTIKKEIKTEVGKQINKGINDLKENLKDKAQEQQKQEQQKQEKQKQQQQQQQQQVQNQNAPKPVVNPTDVPITEMKTWLLVVKDGKPHYNAMDGTSLAKENYILSNVKYEHPDGVKPFMFTTAVATFVAKDGYYFDKQLKLNDQVPQAENTTGFKRVDAKTVKVYLTAFTGAMEHDVRITPAMKAYKDKISNLNLTPVATAKMNTPLFDYWSPKDRWGEDIVDKFVAKNMRAYYAYPTTEEYFDINGNYVKDAKKSSYPSNYTILSVDILDEDLSDDIPGLLGEWCLVDGKKFIPKACLKDIKSGSKYSDGAPAQIIDSPFEFAGGSGTFEDPYLIQTAQQLNAMRKGPQNHYKLIADIDLSDWGNWVPIGGTAAYGFMAGGWNKADKGAFSFQGSFDGNGHVISGMQIIINEETPVLTETGNWRAYGLFGYLATNPVEYKIKNLGVVNFNIDVNYTNVKKNLDLYASAIVGGLNAGTDIVNCYSKGGKISITVKGNEAYKGFDSFGSRPDGAPRINIHVGGICSDGGGEFGGHNSPRTAWLHIEKCFNDSHISVDVQNCEHSIYAGGIIGSMDTSHIHECYNSGNITLPMGLDNIMGSWHESVAAGICATAAIAEIPGIYHKPAERASFIQNCYNVGHITARGASGIFYYSASDIHIENCYNSGTIIGNEFDHSNGASTINNIYSDACGITPYGKEFVRNCSANGNSVTGTAWTTSSTLGRKVLAAIPEDTHPSNIYNVEPDNIGAFTDVTADTWYAEAVKWALDKNIISGTTFSPEKTCTRVQLLTLLWNAAGSPKMSGANPFSDVKSTDSHYDAALWASEMGILSGSTFASQTAVNRGELVISLWKFLGCPEGLQANQYLDIESHQSDFGRAVAWSNISGVMGGTGKFKFSPKKSCTRAETINYIYRALK